PEPASIHWGFAAENNGKVDEFYRAAMSAGARDNISPRARVEYYQGYYAADIFDPDGYSFEVVHKSYRWNLTSRRRRNEVEDESAGSQSLFEPLLRSSFSRLGQAGMPRLHHPSSLENSHAIIHH